MKQLYLFTRDECVYCPAAKAIVDEIKEDTPELDVIFVDADNMDDDLSFELAENQIYIFSTPTIIIGNGGPLKVFSSGKVPDVVALKVAIGG